jgi:hypothetical protein
LFSLLCYISKKGNGVLSLPENRSGVSIFHRGG